MSRAALLFALALGCGPKLEVCRPGQVAPARASVRDAALGYHAFTHAHNDFAHRRPLIDALRARVYSVEADIWFEQGRLEVAHAGVAPRGTLEDLYLGPLQQRVDA